MKKILITAATLLFTTTLISQNTMTNEQKVSYIIGHDIGKNLPPFNYDLDALKRGMQEAFDKKPSQISDQETQQIMMEWQQNMQAAQQNQATAEIDKNKAEGKAFLEKNKQDKDVKVTPSGLQYKVVTMGTGAKPTSPESRVFVHYEGKLLDGTIFDSSYARDQIIDFKLNQVISGWTEGVQLMPIGSKFIFYIPSDLAYGDRGAPGAIPPGATLIFTVELFDTNE
ncbi:MAG: FKBP-type peptidyl-prolyl cis-trans isomerase [Bacteroidales bacterium]|jgi:FKBP-type peptidyl-prolyl cis-trans isomerase|nr:FKBP-type peptidyl-prolyl cis-trans isomerase [Bacteroidales bacterium]